MSDVTEQSARLNTLMRFHQYGEALPFAYKYRLDLQLSIPKSPQIEKALRGVEEVIDQLERKENRWKRYGKTIWGWIVGEHSSAKDEACGDAPQTVEDTSTTEPEDAAQHPGEE